ncbi:hypothetical protein B0A48_12388 [Cryoendolithus antarcticus]|uniref:U3 small nucleolar RNA-associated protein 11 n=1 Tax=Cryoendolithus antarcticus TaxID=1507870 RepID=A0A1V8SRV4_9PEZI|nr:hypothetical protein B0A48_12388 [Cryoendolithus antarcticus]
MSSMRNAVQRRNHKERAQPAERQKWGILEKHKDYSLRAKDHNLKKRKLSALKSKAADRNEDEFYFGMMSSQSRNGVKVAKRGEENAGGGGKTLDMDVVRLMKTQDVGYLRTVLQATRREMEGLEKDVRGQEVGVRITAPTPGGGRVVFGESGEDVVAVPVVAMADDEDDLADLEGMDDEESEAEDEEKPVVPMTKAEKVAAKRKRHGLEVKQNRLESLRDRAKKLSTALREVEDQRVRMSGKGGGVNKKGVVYKTRERAR